MLLSMKYALKELQKRFAFRYPERLVFDIIRDVDPAWRLVGNSLCRFEDHVFIVSSVLRLWLRNSPCMTTSLGTTFVAVPPVMMPILAVVSSSILPSGTFVMISDATLIALMPFGLDTRVSGFPVTIIVYLR